jgi:hypothetical protein
MKVDPEYLAHTLVEELKHVQQIADGVDFASERHLPYDVRRYELEARRFATEALGYEPFTDEAVKRRPEPSDPLSIVRDEPSQDRNP